MRPTWNYPNPWLKQSDDSAVRHYVDLVCRRNLRQAGHGHDVAAYRDDELGAGGKPHFADRHDVMFRSALPIRIGRKAVLRLRNADRKMAVALFLEFPEAIANLLIADDVVRAVDLTRDGLRFSPQRRIVCIQWLELRRRRLDGFHD